MNKFFFLFINLLITLNFANAVPEYEPLSSETWVDKKVIRDADGNPLNMGQAIQEEVLKAENSIQIAVDLLTHEDFCINLKNLKNQKKSLEISIVYNKKSKIIESFKDTGIKVYQIYNFSKEMRMHNKFIIIDNNIVITGSPNITERGYDGLNIESSIIIKDDSISGLYKNYYDYLVRLSSFKFSNLTLSIYKKCIKENIIDLQFVDPKSNKEIWFSPEQNFCKYFIEYLTNNNEKVDISMFLISNEEKKDTDLISCLAEYGENLSLMVNASIADSYNLNEYPYFNFIKYERNFLELLNSSNLVEAIFPLINGKLSKPNVYGLYKTIESDEKTFIRALSLILVQKDPKSTFSTLMAKLERFYNPKFPVEDPIIALKKKTIENFNIVDPYFVRFSLNSLFAKGVQISLCFYKENIEDKPLLHDKLILINPDKVFIGSASLTSNVQANTNFENMIKIEDEAVYNFFLQHLNQVKFNGKKNFKIYNLF